MNRSTRTVFVGLLRTAADSIDTARELVRGENGSVCSRLGYLASELRFTAEAFEGTTHAKA